MFYISRYIIIFTTTTGAFGLLKGNNIFLKNLYNISIEIFCMFFKNVLFLLIKINSQEIHVLVPKRIENLKWHMRTLGACEITAKFNNHSSIQNPLVP